MNRLIDQIQTEISEKSILYRISHIVLSREGLDELFEDFKEEFIMEYIELGRKPNKDDIRDYLSLPILIQKLSSEEKYYLLTKI